MATHPIQTSFSAGEISPGMFGRLDSETYKKALALCENYIPRPQGSLLMRAGSEFVAAAPEAKRVAAFRSAAGGDFVITFGGGVAKIFTVTGEGVTLNPEAVTYTEMVANSDFLTAAGAGWAGVLADFSTLGEVTLRREAANATDPSLRQSLNIAAEQDLSLDIRFKGFATTGSTARVRIGTSADAGDLLDWTGVWASVALHLNHLKRTIHAPVGALYITITAPGVNDPSNPTTLQGFTLDYVSLKGTVATGGGMSIPIPWTDDELPAVQFVAESGADRMVFVHANKAPWFLKRNDANAWDFGDVVFTAKPGSWVGAKWPSTIEFYAGRAYYSGVPGEGNRVWASRTYNPVSQVGGIFDLTLGDPEAAEVYPGNAIDVKVATKGEFRWMKGGRTLLGGTDLGEHAISGSKGVPLVGDIQVRDESAFGAARVQAVFAGSFVLFVSPDRERVRALSYDLQTSGWEQKDVTFLASHILAGKVQELHFTWAPDGLLLAVTQDGQIIGCSFTPGEGVSAWFRVPLPGAVVRSGAIVRGERGPSLWLVVERAVTRLERIPLYDDETVRYLDNSVAGTLDANGSFFFGAPDDFKVRVVVDGSLAGDFPVAGFRVTLGAEQAGKMFIAGEPYLARAKTLPKDTRGGKTRSPKIGVLLNDSALPKLNGRRAPDRRPSTPMDTPEPRTTGRVDVPDLGWTDTGQITIEQDLPFRTEILALYETTQTNEV